MTLWTSYEAAEATGGRVTRDWTATGVSIDTRTLEPGDLFVALKAARDGHDFVAQALENGAAAALVTHVPEGVTEEAPLLIVEDVLAALVDLGRNRRAATSARVAAITGSVGKTSTKEMLRAILSDQGRIHASVASYNNHWGVPLTLARMPVDTDFAVIEIGMNHPGEIAPLARLARPHVAMITTVAAAHLEAFESIEGIAAEKASVLEGVEPGGVAILNRDCGTADILAQTAAAHHLNQVGFGERADDFVLKGLKILPQATVVQAETAGAPFLFKLAVPGAHFAMNGLGALAAAQALGADLARATASLGRWMPYAGRGVRETLILDLVDTHLTLELIDDSYNANPTSIGAALDVLAQTVPTNDLGRFSRGRRIAILGDMKELGKTEVELHRALSDHPAMQDIDIVHTVGPLMQHLHQALPDAKRGAWYATSAEMAEIIPKRLDSGDVVLVKGSLSMALARVVDAIRKMGHAPPPDTTDHEV